MKMLSRVICLGVCIFASILSSTAIADVKYNFYDAKDFFPRIESGVIIGLKSNDQGHVAGIYPIDQFTWHAGYWNGSESFDLGAFYPTRSDGLDINNHDQIVGFSKIQQFQSHATLWDTKNNSMIDLGTLKGGWNSLAFAINDHSQIVGMSDTKSNGMVEQHATLWQNGKVIDLNGYNGERDSIAYDINNHNQVLGYSNGLIESHVIWDVSDLNNIKIQKIENAQEAKAINDSGYVVGGSNDGYAFLWHDGQMTDLNQLIDPSITLAGWHLYNAEAINNDGVISGSAKNIITGERMSFALDPIENIPAIPEPSTYLMFLVGMGLITLSRKIA